jgi:hypothetical protein
MSRHASQEADVDAVLRRDPRENPPNAGRTPPTTPSPIPPTPPTSRHQGSHGGRLNSPGQRSDSQGYETVSWVGEDESAVEEAGAALGAPPVDSVVPPSGVRRVDLSAERRAPVRHNYSYISI